jgi:putative heme transporter
LASALTFPSIESAADPQAKSNANSTVNPTPPQSSRKPSAGGIRRVVGPVLALVVIVVIFAFVIPRFANYSDVWSTVRQISAPWLGVLAIGAALNVATYAPNWMVALPGLSYAQSLRLTLSGTAIANVAPFGGAVSMGMQYRMLRVWGFSTPDSSRAMVITGVWNNLVNLALPLVGLTLLTLKGGRNAALEISARIGAVVFVILLVALWQVLRTEAGARKMGRWADGVRNVWFKLRKRPTKSNAPDAFAAFRADSVALLRARWLALTVTTVVGVLSVFLVLTFAVRAVGIAGINVTFTEAFAAWASTRLLSTAFPVTPGGLGVVDVGLTTALRGFGAKAEPAVAAVLLYRVLTWLPPILLGSVAAFTWRKANPENIAASK